jgi:hypothetical protein
VIGNDNICKDVNVVLRENNVNTLPKHLEGEGRKSILLKKKLFKKIQNLRLTVITK